MASLIDVETPRATVTFTRDGNGNYSVVELIPLRGHLTEHEATLAVQAAVERLPAVLQARRMNAMPVR